MQHLTAIKLYLIGLFVVSFSISAKSQLCTGSLGDPVININFGAGTNPGPALSAAATNYQFVSFDCPNDNYYTVRNATVNCFSSSWHSLLQDHTGDANGYFMLVNASIQPSDFYVDTVRGLCPGTTFEFAAWISNMITPSACGGNSIQPNITFSIETKAGVVLSSFNSGNIPPTAAISWQQYGLYFKTPPGVSDVVVRMKNNAPGGCGNDLALDDITFRPCGPLINSSINGLGLFINVCEGDTASVKLSAQTSGGYTSPVYQWQISTDNGGTWVDIPGADSTVYKRVPTKAGKYLYRMAVAEAGNIGLSTCRVVSTALTVTVNPLPVPAAGNDGPKCAGSSFNLTAGGGSTYLWTGPGNYKAATQTAVVANGANGAKYFVAVTNGYNCTAVDSTVLAAYANPVAAFKSGLPACAASAVGFTNQSSVAAGETITNYQWLFGDGANSSSTNPSHVYANANNYPVGLVVTTNLGCKDSITQAVVVHYLPQPAFALPKVCLSDPFAVFTDASTIGDTSQASFTYLWNFGDPNATVGNPNLSTSKNPQHSYTATGVYNVRLTVTSNNGCVRDTIEPFTVNGAFPKAAFAVNNGDSICSNTSLVLTDRSTVNFGSITSIVVYWDYNNTPLDKMEDDSTKLGKQYTKQYPVFDIPATKNYAIHYVASSGINCVSEIDTVITLKASPVVSFSTLAPVCQGVAPFTITQGTETNGVAGAGFYTGRGVDSVGVFNPQQAGVGLDTLLYTVAFANGCRDAVRQAQLVYAQPVANAGPDRQLLQGGSLVIAATASGNNPTYLWTPNTFIDNNTLLTPSVSPVADITYTLAVTSADGCVAKDSMFITVLKTPLVPNAFSPNGDGINDYWMINYLNSYANVTVQVFNRYGQQVFASKGYSTPWDGTVNGKALPVGTYYYIIDRKVAGAGLITGWVAIVK